MASLSANSRVSSVVQVSRNSQDNERGESTALAFLKEWRATLAGIAVSIVDAVLNSDSRFSLLTSAIFILLGLQVDQIFQSRSTFALLKRQMTGLAKGIRRVNSTAEVIDAYQSIEDDSDSIRRLLVRAREVQAKQPRIAIQRRKENILAWAADQMEALCSYDFESFFWKCNVLEGAVEEMEESGSGLLGVSPWLSTDEEWWTTPEGVKFFEANKRAHDRGCRVRRIFVCNESIDGSLKASLKRHHDSGFEVRILKESEWPKSLGEIEAMAVIDGWIAFRGATQKNEMQCSYNKFTTNPDRVRRRGEKLEKLWKLAEKNGNEISGFL